MNASVVAAPASVVFVQSQRSFADFADEWRRKQAIEPPPSPTLMPSALWGPWIVNIPEADRRAGLRALAALCCVFVGSSAPVVGALRRAETSPDTAGAALKLFDRIPSRQRRNVLCSYAALMKPRP
jgi:hypothetical protein